MILWGLGRKAALAGSLHCRRGNTALFVLFVSLAVIVLLIPRDPLAIRGLGVAVLPNGGEKIFVFGNSVVKTASACDRDVSTIPEILQAVSGRQAVDLSRGGEALDFAINVADWIGKTRPKSTIVIYLSAFHFTYSNSTSLWSQFSFSATNPSLLVNSLAQRFSAGVWLNPAAGDGPFSYQGAAYPGLGERTAIYYPREKLAQTCPQPSVGHDRKFIAANYWSSYVRNDPDRRYFRDLSSLQQQMAKRGGRLVLILLPIDMQDVRDLDPALYDEVAASHARIATGLAASGVVFSDLANVLPAGDFADRYCACGHLAVSGRRFVAQATLAAIQGR